MKKNNYKLLFIILSFGIFIYFYRLSNPSLWLDEAHTIWIAQKSPIEIIKYVNIYEIHPYFYYLFLHFWMYLGSGEFVLRFPSALMGIVQIYGVYLLARELSNEKGALLSAFFVSFSSFELLFFQEIRMYPFLIISVTLSVYYFIKALKTGKTKYWIFYGLFLLLGIYTDYRMILIIAASSLFFLIGITLASRNINFFQEASRFKSQIKQFIFTNLVAALIAIPLTPVLLRQSGPQGCGTSMKLFLPKISLVLLLKSILNFFTGEIINLNSTVIFISTFLLIACLSIGLSLLIREKGIYGVFLPFIFLFSFFIMVFYSIFKASIFSAHSLMFLSPIFLIMLAQSTLEIFKKFKPILYIIILCFLGLNIFSIYLWFFSPTHTKQNFKAVVSFICPRLDKNDKIVIVPEYQAFPFMYYYRRYGRTNKVLKLTPKDLKELSIRNELTGAQRVWWIFAADKFIDPRGRIRSWLDKNFTIKSAVEFPHIKYHAVTGKSIQVYLAVPK